MIRILPQKFYEAPEISKILVDGLSCAIHKVVDEPVYKREGYLSTHAVTMVLKGILRIENEDGLYEEVSAGKMVFMPKGLYTISDILPQSGSYEAMMFFFEAEIVQQFLESIAFRGNREKCVTHAVFEATPDIQYFGASLMRLYGNAERPNRQLTGMKLFELLHLINNSGPEKNRFATMLASLNNLEKKSLRAIMEANYLKPLSIEDYAYLTGRSLSTFRRDFKMQFGGISPKQWLIDRRLEKAHELLSKSQSNVSNILLEVGYENFPHFIKAFRNKYGVPPRQFLIQKRMEAMV